jgi:hypothetical protein
MHPLCLSIDPDNLSLDIYSSLALNYRLNGNAILLRAINAGE